MSPKEPPTIGCSGSNIPGEVVSNSGVTKRYDNIIKSQQDKREYRGLELSNQMKVLLVSDPSADKSAAALDVSIGHLSDPDDLPGLAHFCEHMLFLGTEKYPEENYYTKFLSEHGGSTNAATGTDHTVYYFDVLPDHLGKALDIFAQFFISPLFTESATSREVSAVHSEHEMNIPSDSWRLDQLYKSVSDPTHPYHKFGTGNRDTLETIPKSKGIDVRKELLYFHQKWYSSNIMTLVVLGKESLDELEVMVVELFSDVENRSVKVPTWPDHPSPPALRRKRAYCLPVKDTRSLYIDFATPDYRQYYKSAPCNYLSHLVGHEGPGSLLSALKARSWCNSLSSYSGFAARGFGFFELQVDLTEDGMDHINEIITIVFQYISMLRNEGPRRWVWEEQRDLKAMQFRFKDSEEPIDLVVNNVELLQELPMEDILSAYYLTTEWRPDLVEEILSLLTPDNVCIMISAQRFSEKCTQTERWYGTKYLQEEIEDSLIKKWKSVQPIPELYLPPVNEFIPTNLNLETSEDPTSDAIAPSIIKDTPLVRLWFKKDKEFLLPKAMLYIDLNSPLAYSDPLNCNLMVVWRLLLEDCLQQSTYAAGIAGLSWTIGEDKYGLSITIEGYDDKQHVLLQKIVDKIVDFKADPQRFEIMKENEIRAIKNFDADQPYTQATSLEDQCLLEVVWTRPQLLASFKDMKVQQLDDFVTRFMKNIHIECLMYGNLTREKALQISDILESRIVKDAIPLHAQQLLLYREVEIDKGAWYLLEAQNNVHKSTCACVYYACGVCDSRQNATIDLLVSVLWEPCFDVLRTKEQLGYIVSSELRVRNGAQGLRVYIQNDRHHPAYVEGRIEAFIDSFLGCLENMNEEEFLKHRSALAARRLEKPKRMSSKAIEMWVEITLQEYNFDRARVEVNELNTITKDELIEFYKKHISASSAERRKLSVHVVSTAEGGVGSERDNNTSQTHEEHDKQPTKITNLVEFKSQRRLYPLPIPYINIPPKGASFS